MIQCPYCSATEKQHRKGYSRTGLQRFRCDQCGRQYTSETIPHPLHTQAPILRPCAQCGKETTNPKFCSKACNIIYNNHLHPKRKKLPHFCKYCGALVKARETVCAECRQNNVHKVDWSKRTIGEIRRTRQHATPTVLRNLAKDIYEKSGRAYICQRCGYSKHVEICHIASIKSFSDDTPAMVVSRLDNLIALCPNCHWEFDHGFLKIEDIPS